MDKKFYKECIEKEVYSQYRQAKKRLTLFDKIWCKHIKQFLERRRYYEEIQNRIYNRRF